MFACARILNISRSPGTSHLCNRFDLRAFIWTTVHSQSCPQFLFPNSPNPSHFLNKSGSQDLTGSRGVMCNLQNRNTAFLQSYPSCSMCSNKRYLHQSVLHHRRDADSSGTGACYRDVMPSSHSQTSANLFPVHRHFTTGVAQYATKGPGVWTRAMWRLGFGRLRYGKTKMRIAGYQLYSCCDELVDHVYITQVLGLPDTFYSWFLSMELHVWLLMTRLQLEGEEGKFVRHMLVKAMWDDVENRSKRLGHAAQTSARKLGIKELNYHFQAALFAYDEGSLGDDKVLAAAIWRIIFEMKLEDPDALELIVEYIRKQLKHLDEQQSELLLYKGQATFLPLYGEVEETEKIQEKMESIKAKHAAASR